jgi:hypothetical protein
MLDRKGADVSAALSARDGVRVVSQRAVGMKAMCQRDALSAARSLGRCAELLGQIDGSKSSEGRR